MTAVQRFVNEVDNYLKENKKVSRLDLRVAKNKDKAEVAEMLTSLGYRVEWTMQNDLVLIR